MSTSTNRIEVYSLDNLYVVIDNIISSYARWVEIKGAEYDSQFGSCDSEERNAYRQRLERVFNTVREYNLSFFLCFLFIFQFQFIRDTVKNLTDNVMINGIPYEEYITGALCCF